MVSEVEVLCPQTPFIFSPFDIDNHILAVNFQAHNCPEVGNQHIAWGERLPVGRLYDDLIKYDLAMKDTSCRQFFDLFPIKFLIKRAYTST